MSHRSTSLSGMTIAATAALTVVASMVPNLVPTAMAQTPGNRADHGSRDSRIVGPMAPGSAPAAKGANNPGGLGKGPADMPEEPRSGAGLPGAAGANKPPSESAGKGPTSGLSGSPRKGTGGASIDQVTPPDTKAR
ncbi:hypothetical protein [Cupriavidus plantarum]|uniref:hypothetical protein n=1 Tax=Cupriavidus plantarum TaxID=942865 RepID=UPI000F2853AF|nr:hypothetical protein [Cupriavidus plantarum]RLK31713.1 hypothetical protein C7417_4691 [Cupriavidus plantarum]